MVGDIISEWRAASSWNNGRLHLGISTTATEVLYGGARFIAFRAPAAARRR
jgi:hypothetical protein